MAQGHDITEVHLDPHLDPLDQRLSVVLGSIMNRLAALEKVVFAPPTLEAREPTPHQVSLDRQARNIERLVRAYDLLSDKDVRVKLTCEGHLPRDYQEIHLDLPAETSE